MIPRCPHCGKPLTINLRSDNRFVEDAGWHAAAHRYSEFLRRHKGMKVLLLELGVGYNTPGIIRYPFWQMTAQNSKAVYACLNFSQAVCPPEIEQQSICINGDVGEVLQLLSEKHLIVAAANQFDSVKVFSRLILGCAADELPPHTPKPF